MTTSMIILVIALLLVTSYGFKSASNVINRLRSSTLSMAGGINYQFHDHNYIL